MKKKTIMLIMAMAFTFLLGKAGYAYYENLSEKNAIEQVESSQIADNSIATSSKLVINLGETDNQDDTMNEARKVFDSATSGPVSMFDEKGNIKNSEKFEEELFEYYENGQINSDDLEYYLFMHSKCVETYGSNTSNQDVNSYSDSGVEFDKNVSLVPSCH